MTMSRRKCTILCSLPVSPKPMNRKNIKFGIASASEIAEVAEVEVCNRELYSVTSRDPVAHGCLDRKLVRESVIIRGL